MSTIISISPSASNAAHILVDVAYAQGLHRHLRDEGIIVHPLTEAITRTVRAYVDRDGRKQIITEPLDMAFDALATPNMLEPIVGKWLESLP